MINTKDVIRMRVPYPSISDKLAVNLHMYICKQADMPAYEFIKCQTLKPYMLSKEVFRHYVDEEADTSRNPFQKTTRIDCDKTFTTKNVLYDDCLKTITRPDICQELFDDVIEELNTDGYRIVDVNEEELAGINPLIVKIESM